MNKFTKISATALFALFLTACDKPADKPTPVKTEINQPASEVKQEEAKTAETATSVEAANAQEQADYNKLLEWNASQAQTQMTAQQKLQSDLNTAVNAKDDKKIEEAIKTFNKTVEDTIASLDKLDITAPSVKSIKDQNKDVLVLSSELLVDQLNLSTKTPTEEQTKLYQAKVEKLQAAVAKLQKDGADLAQKFAPAAPAAPAAK
ncbi:lipoprotein HlpB [Haemophilus parainfluenzae]|uniref:lipoprotein HlpB n=1 Tax=Haemophilus parainfluenzae TaxID=729 RepID=UPI000FFEC580|nr:lipoprotein HlpB [Haemophilus parainfluenzae]KAB1991767.1 lipoprotein HlpB [Haemophilus parainfluenzae]MBS6188434.1 lipoprotein HlpB [Haemophilus parainfluenzae]MDU4896800.1 lipoprotein HlpB [Haemophilus parainfluenzae]QAT95478.1 lipoprotein HlpB [Haemophilus parainfluenzae]